MASQEKVIQNPLPSHITAHKYYDFRKMKQLHYDIAILQLKCKFYIELEQKIIKITKNA